MLVGFDIGMLGRIACWLRFALLLNSVSAKDPGHLRSQCIPDGVQDENKVPGRPYVTHQRHPRQNVHLLVGDVERVAKLFVLNERLPSRWASEVWLLGSQHPRSWIGENE